MAAQGIGSGAQNSWLATRYRLTRSLDSRVWPSRSEVDRGGARFLVEDEVRGLSRTLTLLPSQSSCGERLRDLWRRLSEAASGYLEEPLSWERDGSSTFYISSYDEGLHLGQVGILSWKELSPIIVSVLHGLSLLHHQGVVHGRVRAESIFWRGDQKKEKGRRFILRDYRSCQEVGRQASAEWYQGAGDTIAPELRGGGAALDRRTDLYALGRVIQGACPKLPKKIEHLVARLVSATPEERPVDAAEVLEALGVPEQSQSGEPPALLDQEALRSFRALLAQLLDGETSARALCLISPDADEGARLVDECAWRAGPAAQVVHVETPYEGVVDALSRGTQGRATRRKELRPETDSLTELLRVRAELEEKQLPVILFVKELDALGTEERRLVEILLRTADEEDHLMVVLATRHAIDAGSAAVKQLKLRGLNVGQQKSSSSPSSVGRTVPTEKDGAEVFLGSLAALEGSAEESELPSIPTKTRRALEHARWIESQGGRIRLVRPAEAEAILLGLPPARRKEAHLFAAQSYARLIERSPGGDPVARQKRVTHLALAGDGAAAEEFLRYGTPETAEGWLPSVDALLSQSQGIDVVLLAARVLTEAGKSERALQLLGDSISPSSASERARVRRAKARSHLHQRDTVAAIADLHEESPDDPEVSEILSRCHVLQGDYRRAIDLAERALERAPLPDVAGRLQDALGVAQTYLGNTNEARRHLGESSRLHAGPRALARTASYRALSEYRAGNIEGAARGYLESYRLAVQCGATDLIFYAIQNVATASHQRGDLGRALSAYTQALDMARALDNQAAAVGIRLNLAKLYVDWGLFDRAEAAIDRLRDAAVLDALTQASVDEVQGDIARYRGDTSGALKCYASAKKSYESQGLTREVTEVSLSEALSFAEEGKSKEAQASLDRARHSGSSSGVADLDARLQLTLGVTRLRAGDARAALAELRAASQALSSLGFRALLGECETRLFEASREVGTDFQVQNYRRLALETWERIAATLPEHLLHAYWAHPLRRELRGEGTLQDAPSERLDYFLAINRHLRGEVTERAVLELCLEAAVYLSDAERGAVLLFKDGALFVAHGNTDEEFARTVGERALSEKKAILVADISEDIRFLRDTVRPHEEVRSVLCVPILGEGGVLGALYIDHRYRSGAFRAEDATLLMGLADQLALGLSRLGLQRALDSSRQELKEERQKLARLLERGDALPPGQTPPSSPPSAPQMLVGKSPAMVRVLSTLKRVADTPVPVLIQGESGTGKELLARSIHEGSRPDGPLVSINCGALPENLLEAELFGVRRGAFTGASENRVGLLASASGGTVFLDELGEMPQSMQVKLLRALQEREVTPVGGREVQRIDIRLVCATNRNLKEEVAGGRFREDLYYRVSVVEVVVPPLRERLDDVPALADHLLKQIAERTGVRKKLAPAGLRKLLEYSFPGNVRELENILTKAALLSEGPNISGGDLYLEQREPEPKENHRDEFQRREAKEMLTMLRQCRWNVSKAARSLGIPRASFYRKMERYGIGQDSAE